MKRRIAAGLSIFAVAATVGWKLASQPETSTGLQEVSLNQSSEHSYPGSSKALAGIRVRISPSDLGYEMSGVRVRISPSDFGYQLRASADQVPQISVVAD